MVDVRIDSKGFQQAMKYAPQNLFREIRKAWKAHHRRFTRKMERERMSGRPGLKTPTGKLKAGLIVKEEGHTLNSLQVVSVFTGIHAFFAHVHETGMTIRAKGGGYLTFPIRAKTAARSTKITGWVRVKEVTIPPRLGFVKMFKRMIPELVGETQEAVGRALKGDKVGR